MYLIRKRFILRLYFYFINYYINGDLPFFLLPCATKFTVYNNFCNTFFQLQGSYFHIKIIQIYLNILSLH